MSDLVLIKSFPNGIALHLNAEAPFDELIEEMEYKFSQARAFFGSSAMALSIEGRQVSGAEEARILDAIRSNSDLKVICIVEKDDEINREYVKALAQTQQKLSDGDEGQFFRGSLKNREVVETDNSIIILGDIYPGSAVISAKNIIVLGGLYGEAYAGGNGQPGAFIAALEMEPERIKIGDFKYKPGNKQSRWGIRPKVQPKVAYVKNDKIMIEALTKELLSGF